VRSDTTSTPRAEGLAAVAGSRSDGAPGNAAQASEGAIGVFDSGVGGLSIVAAIRCALPGREIVYYADTAFAPYGPRSDTEILERTRICCEHLVGQKVAALVVACNTATANAIDEVRTWAPVPVVGVEPGLKPAATATRNSTVGVLATQATLASRRYRNLLARVTAQWPDVKFVEHAARGWVELVEAGDLHSVQARTRVREALEPLSAQGTDTIVLGCTHYPFLRHLIAAVVPSASLIETGPAVARELCRRLGLAEHTGRVHPETQAALRLESSGDAAQLAALASTLLETA